MVVHVVFFTPKPEVGTDGLRLFAQSIQELLRQIPGVERALVGKALHVPPEYSRSMGETTYEFAAVLEFQSTQQLVEYLNHPAHRQLGRLFWDYCGAAVVMEAEMHDVLRSELADLV